MKTKLLTIVGALLIICPSAFADPNLSTTVSGAQPAGEKPVGVCDCDVSAAPLQKKNEHNAAMPAGTPTNNGQGQGSDASGATGSSGAQ